MRLCAHLRWKTFYGTRWETREQLDTDLLRGDTSWTCLHTCQAWGPDDDLTAPERCQDDRPCFEPSPREPRDTPAA